MQDYLYGVRVRLKYVLAYAYFSQNHQQPILVKQRKEKKIMEKRKLDRNKMEGGEIVSEFLTLECTRYEDIRLVHN